MTPNTTDKQAERIAALEAERDSLRDALRMIQDPALSGKTWEQVVVQQVLNPHEDVSGDDFCAMMCSCWRYTRIADFALAGEPIPDRFRIRKES